MTFCEDWRQRVKDWGCFDDGAESFNIELDDVDLAVSAMKALRVSQPSSSVILLPIPVESDSEIIKYGTSTGPGVLCELPLDLGSETYTLAPSLLAVGQYETILGSIENPFKIF